MATSHRRYRRGGTLRLGEDRLILLARPRATRAGYDDVGRDRRSGQRSDTGFRGNAVSKSRISSSKAPAGVCLRLDGLFRPIG